MSQPIPLEDLEIVGYANVLAGNMLPAVVPPVFRFKDGARVLLPPYSLLGGYVCNGTVLPQAELEALKAREEITLFDRPFPPLPDYELWIDRNFELRYQPFDEARRQLGDIAEEAILAARSALQRGDPHEAESQAGVAICANDRRLEPLAIKAAIRRRNSDRAGERLMANLAAGIAGSEAFNTLVDQYAACSPAPPARKTPSTQSPLFGMAAIRPSAAAA